VLPSVPSQDRAELLSYMTEINVACDAILSRVRPPSPPAGLLGPQ
jgi:hypothetical protein